MQTQGTTERSVPIAIRKFHFGTCRTQVVRLFEQVLLHLATRQTVAAFHVTFQDSESKTSRDLLRKGPSVPLACIQQLSNDFGAIVFAGQLCSLATNILRVLQSCLRLAKTRSVRLTPSAAKYCSSQSLASQSHKVTRLVRTV